MGELDGKVGIVTGSGRLRGIGRATAVALARLGADVVVTGTGRDPKTFPPDEKEADWKDIESTADQVRHALPLVVDVTDAQQVQTMVDRTLRELGRVPILELAPNIFQRVVDVKVLGTFLCTKAVVKVLIEQGEGGKIVNVSSGSGKTGSPSNLAYNAACFAQVGMTQSCAKELGPHGINVNCVCPGGVDTSRVDDLGRGDKWRQMAAAIPIGRFGTDTEVGEFITYLCTEASSWIHGQSINMDGGGTMEH